MSNQGVSPVDYTTSVGQFRALIGDTDAEGVTAGVGDYAWYGDEAIEGIVSVYAGNVKRAAAQALRTIASTQALLLKKWSADDLSVDGAAIARELRELARGLDEQAAGEDGMTDIFEMVYFGQNHECHPELSPFTFGKRYGLCECGGGC